MFYPRVSANLKLGDTGHSSIKEGGSMSEVAGSSNSYKPITNTAWVRARMLPFLIDFWCFNATFNNISAISW
jgi:hypothetical protein